MCVSFFISDFIIIIAAVVAVTVFIASNPGRSFRFISDPIPTRIFNINIVQNIINRPPPKSPDKIQHFICPAFVGRVGNQLFLFASSYGIARSKGMKVIINYNCQLFKVFNLKVDIRQDTSICNSPKVKILKEAHSAVFDKRLTEFPNTSEVRLTLYLQSYLYFDKYSNELRKQFTFKEKIRTKAISVLDYYLKKYNVSRQIRGQNLNGNQKESYFVNYNVTFKTKATLIGVHVRRGDWEKYPETGYNLATKEYLQKAIGWYQTRYEHLFFVVASNGMAWSKKNMPKNINVIYLEGNSPWEDMATVTLCDHFIATVGTFSWWAAWLTGGNVTYYKWPAREGTRFRKSFSKDYKDHYYPHWIGL